ncbi:MAG: carbon-nitrogen family hydrolase [Candidatus Micrarchaeia archaeon]|jgi:predicted amidohydrolase
MKVAICQLDIIPGNKEANFEKVAAFAAQAKEKGADLLVLPETFAIVFSMGVDEISELKKDSATLKFIKKTAKKNGIWILGTLVEKTKGGNKNAAYLIDRNGRTAKAYHKIHLFPLTEEDKKCVAGSKLAIADIEGIKCGISTCYDLRFPEMFRALAKKGATVIFVVSNWPEKRKEHWLALLKARAIENQCYVIGVNRVGNDGKEDYSGDSRIYGPFGEELLAVGKEEGIFIGEIDLEKVKEIRKTHQFLPKEWGA